MLIQIRLSKDTSAYNEGAPNGRPLKIPIIYVLQMS